jgi:uncharacterized tellurite resistance protein B-like protein
MIDRLKQLWQQAAARPREQKQHTLSLAVAALMVEVMRMDGQLQGAERSAIMQSLQQRFGLAQAEIHQLIGDALYQVKQALDLHQFTSVVVQGFSTDERVGILAELWAVAMADGEVDPYEEQLIRRMADLIGLHHSQFIEAKIAAGAA